MAKFSKAVQTLKWTAQSPLRTTSVQTHTYEGGLGFERDARTELFLLAVSNMVAEDTFYESARERDSRFVHLIHQVTAEEPDWVAGFVPYLRDVMQMRSGSMVLAAEYVAAGGPNGRRVVASALQRADEPAEMLAYWAQAHGKNFPQPLKRGVADAVERLYTEQAALKYDGLSRGWRMGDVIDLVHPRPAGARQSALFRYLLDHRHNRDNGVYDELETIERARALERVPVDERRTHLDPETLARAGMTWERLSGWLQGPMDAQAWEAVIPNMGYMALIRNLRNFEDTGVREELLTYVAAKIADPQEVARSRQFPIRFYSAYTASQSTRFAWPLEQALETSLAHVPSLSGRTLVLVDVSGSMFSSTSRRTAVLNWEIAALFGAALAKRAEQADVYAYSNDEHRVAVRSSLLRTVPRFRNWRGVGGGTQTLDVLGRTYDGQDRVVILTDEQAFPSQVDPRRIPAPIYTFNVVGYRPAQMEQGKDGRYVFGGLTDAGFVMLHILEQMHDGAWPWQTE